MPWKPVDITSPESWYRSKAWQWGDSKWIVATAFNPRAFAFGYELITGYGNGIGFIIGPLWLGVAARFEADAPQENK